MSILSYVFDVFSMPVFIFIGLFLYYFWRSRFAGGKTKNTPPPSEEAVEDLMRHYHKREE